MTFGRLFAIGLVFVFTTIAWFILGGTLVARSGEGEESLRQEVASLWGGTHQQNAPNAWYETRREVVDEDGKVQTVTDPIPAQLVSSEVDVRLALDHRRKGLLWFDTYGVQFSGAYVVENPDAVQREILVHFAFPSAQGLYDGFQFRVNGVDAPPVGDLSAGVTAKVVLAPHGRTPVEVRYRSRGLGDWTYAFGAGVSQVRAFALTMHTDFDAVDFPPGTLSPDVRKPEGEGQELHWRFGSLVTGQKIGVDLPDRTNPGPLAARISFFAPVSLLFFITVLVLQGVIRRRSLHPMHYFFLSTAFFAFHLLLAYLVDHLDVLPSFLVASAVSLALGVSYLRLASGWRFALEAGVAQLVYLVLFSYAFFFEGYTGLTVAVGAVATLFVLMQMTGRVDWNEVFARRQGEPQPMPYRSPPTER